VWEPAGDDPALAIINLRRRTSHCGRPRSASSQHRLRHRPNHRLNHPHPSPSRTTNGSSPIAAKYIAEIAKHKSKKTLAAYRLTVLAFCAVTNGVPLDQVDEEDFLKGIATQGKYIEDISRDDLLSYASALKQEGCGPRTVRNRIDQFQIFLHHFNLGSLLKGKDLPKFTDKKVRAYNPLELGKMFGHADADESDLLTFLLCTGAREQEAQYVCWPDVDLERATYTVTEHLDLDYTPKDKEEGTLPLPDLLIDRLKARRKRNPKDRLIFPGKDGKPNGHALRIVKQLLFAPV
jgi:integrase